MDLVRILGPRMEKSKEYMEFIDVACALGRRAVARANVKDEPPSASPPKGEGKDEPGETVVPAPA